MDLSKALNLIHLALSHRDMIADIKKSGEPLLASIKRNAPELGQALTEFSAATLGQAADGDDKIPSNPEAHEKAIAKAIFSPHEVSKEEQAWMDRASQTSGM